MSAYEPLWIPPPENPQLIEKIIGEFNVHPAIAQIFVSRGFEDLNVIHEFLYAKLPNLFDPSLFPEIDQAVERVLLALRKNESILIYGDNDVDGMTATALLTEFLKSVGGSVFFYVPNRSVMTKHLIGDALEVSLKNKCSLIITVDCGITAAKEIEEVVRHGIDVIVTDHHEPTSKIPHCIATLNPKLENSTYPNRDITGVGVAFKLAHALTNRLMELEEIKASSIDLKNYLDLVALGTIADMGALKGENRILVRYGLKQMRRMKRVGLAKLFQVSDLRPVDITPMDIASRIAPRLNSLGRVADPIKGVELLLIRDPDDAERLAQELDLFNFERQKIEREASYNIDTLIADHPVILQDRAIVLDSHHWHSGVIAIIAARIAKQYNRPTVIISVEQGVGKGSIRTIPEFPLLPALKRMEDLLINYGGHDFAAGMTIKEEHISEFKRRFINETTKALQQKDVISKLFLDATIDFQDLTFDFMESLSLLEPFGHENPQPTFFCDAIQTWPPKVIGSNHLKFFLAQEERSLEGIGFNLAHRRDQIRQKDIHLRVAFSPQVNLFLNKASIQLLVKDFKKLD